MPADLDELDDYRERDVRERRALRQPTGRGRRPARSSSSRPCRSALRPLVEAVNFITVALLPALIRDQYGFAPVPPGAGPQARRQRLRRVPEARGAAVRARRLRRIPARVAGMAGARRRRGRGESPRIRTGRIGRTGGRRRHGRRPGAALGRDQDREPDPRRAARAARDRRARRRDRGPDRQAARRDEGRGDEDRPGALDGRASGALARRDRRSSAPRSPSSATTPRSSASRTSARSSRTTSGCRSATHFADFESEAFAAASIGQVHRATHP